MKAYISSLSNKQRSLLSTVQNGSYLDVRLLLMKFPNFTEDTTFSYVLLVASLHRGNGPISTLLIEKRCNVTSCFKTGCYSVPLYYAIMQDNMRIFSEMYRIGASVHHRDANSETPLELAIRGGLLKFLDIILSKKDFDDIDPKCEEHVAIFHVACLMGRVEIMREFLDRGFSVNSRSNFHGKRWSGATPIQLALEGLSTNTNAVKFLLQFCIDFNVQDEQGNTILLSAFEKFDKNSSEPYNPLFDDILRAYLQRYDVTKFNNPTNQDGLSHFHVLCSIGWESESGDESPRLLNILECFIKKGVNIDSPIYSKIDRDNQVPYYIGYTALYWAVQKFRLRTVKLLLENGADPTKTDAKGSTLLHILDFKNPDSVEMAELLLKHGANIDAKNNQNDTPLHLAFYAQKRNETLMQLLLSASHEVSNFVNNDGLSYLHISSSRDFGKVKTLVENGASIENCIESNRGGLRGYSALLFAIIFNKVEIVQYLLAHGAKTNTIVGENGSTLLHLACTEPLKYFSNPPTKKNDLCIIQALQSGNQSEDINWVKDRRDQIRIIEMLLEHGARADTRDATGMTPLFSVCASSYSVTSDSSVWSDDFISKEIVIRQKLIIDVLLHHGADLNSRENHERSVLHILSENIQVNNAIRDLAEFLLSRGANVDAVDIDGYTPLHSAIGESWPPRGNGALLQNFLAFINLLIEHGANVNSRCNELRTPLHSVVELYGDDENEQILMKLLNHPDIEVDSQDQEGHTPLFDAVSTCESCCVSKLLNAGADVGARRDNDESPISYLHDRLKPPHYGSVEDELNVSLIIIKHVKKLMKLKYSVSDEVKTHFHGIMNFIEKDLSTIDSAIDEEVEKLKSIKVDNYTSLFEILIKDPNTMTYHARNDSFVEIVSSTRLQSDFPLFSGFLERQFSKGLARSLILEPAKKTLRVVTRTNWPDSCSEHILSYLNNAHLKLLTQCLSVIDTCGKSSDVLGKENVTSAKVPRRS